jgi:hypothetical protein
MSRMHNLDKSIFNLYQHENIRFKSPYYGAPSRILTLEEFNGSDTLLQHTGQLDNG